PDPDNSKNPFAFEPDEGVHDIHMNQGNPPHSHDQDNGVWQDGGLLFEFPDGTFSAVFLAFQTQKWHTDEQTGNLLSGSPDLGPATTPPTAEPDGDVVIAAAVVNPVGPDEGGETVTLLNTTQRALNLSGWVLLDRLENRFPLSGTVKAGDSHVVAVSSP